jgi:hypothetical protein
MSSSTAIRPWVPIWSVAKLTSGAVMSGMGYPPGIGGW